MKKKSPVTEAISGALMALGFLLVFGPQITLGFVLFSIGTQIDPTIPFRRLRWSDED